MVAVGEVTYEPVGVVLGCVLSVKMEPPSRSEEEEAGMEVILHVSDGEMGEGDEKEADGRRLKMKGTNK